MCPTDLARNLYSCQLTQCMKLRILEWAFLLVSIEKVGGKSLLFSGESLIYVQMFFGFPVSGNPNMVRRKECFIKASHISGAFQQHTFDEITQNGSEEAN